MNDDASLLRAYADEKSEAAFTELVRRHLDLVYGAALRRTGGDAHTAADVAQQVFTNLARNARDLSRHAILSAWLHTATRNAALNLMISDQRRKARESAALAHQAADEASPDWERLRPLLDGAIDELPEADRSAVVLRFLERRAFADVGTALRVSEDAARMRVDRALEKLRAALARRGVNSTSAALATVFANQVAASAPAGLATSISGAVLASAAASGGLAAPGVGVFMSMKSTVILGAIALAALVATYFQWNRAYRAESELAALTVDRDGLRSQLRAEQQRAARDGQDLAALRSEVEALKAKPVVTITPTQPMPAPEPEPSPLAEKLRRSTIDKAMLVNLRKISAAAVRFNAEQGRPPASLQEIVGEGKILPTLKPANGEDYSSLPLGPHQALTVTDSEGGSITFDPSAIIPPPPEITPAEQEVRDRFNKIKVAVDKAVEGYRAANGGANPPSPQAMLPFFSTPQEGADFLELLEAQKAARAK